MPEQSPNLVEAIEDAIEHRDFSEAVRLRGEITLKLIDLERQAALLRHAQDRVTDYIVSGDPEVIAQPTSVYGTS